MGDVLGHQQIETIDIPVPPSLTMASLRAHSSVINNIEQSPLADLHSSMALHAISVIETHTLLFEVYSILWQSIRYVQGSSQMSSRTDTSTNSSGLGSWDDTHEYGPPDPEPPAAPPYVSSASNPSSFHHQTSHTKIVTVLLTISTQNHHPFPIW
jgi:hypothetical protein